MTRLPTLLAAFAAAVVAVAPPVLAHAQAGPAPGEAPICTDRPTKGTSTCTAEVGTFQVESDVFSGTFLRLDGVSTDTYLVTNPTLKYGVSKSLDIEVNIAPYEFVRTRSGSAGVDVEGGVGDLYLRAKYAAYNSADGRFAFSIVPYVKAPTARSGIGDGAWEGGAVAAISYKITDKLSLALSPELDAFEDSAGDGRHLNHIEVGSLNYSLPDSVTISGEIFGDWNYDPAGEIDQYSADVALAWGVTNFLQLDAGLNFGLNRYTPGVQGYVGVSKKF